MTVLTITDYIKNKIRKWFRSKRKINKAINSIAVFTHIYYEEHFDSVIQHFSTIKELNCNYYFNLCLENKYSTILEEKIRYLFPKAIIIKTPNKGRDIGGKLALLDIFLRNGDNSDLILFLHDKVSPHTSMGESWRNKLFSIIDHHKAPQIVKEFSSDKNVGLIGSKFLLLNEYDISVKKFKTTNSEILLDLITEYELKNTDYTFIGGTMFWVRTSIFRDFFTKYSPLSIRKKLENGNIMDYDKGTFTHSWERMLCWIVTNKGYSLKGL